MMVAMSMVALFTLASATLTEMAGALGLGPFVGSDLAELVARLAVDLLVIGVVMRRAYGGSQVSGPHELSCFMFNAITFLVCFLLRKVPVELGFALGLFAVFGILRYRTEALRTRDLTYLFVSLGIAILNAMANEHVSLAELLVVNGVIVVGTVLLEARRPEALASQKVTYDNMEMLRSRDRDALREDLAARTGLSILRIEVQQINLLRDTAEIRVYYHEER